MNADRNDGRYSNQMNIVNGSNLLDVNDPNNGDVINTGDTFESNMDELADTVKLKIGMYIIKPGMHMDNWTNGQEMNLNPKS